MDNKKRLTLLGIGLGLILFFALNIAANAGLRSVRADLTEDNIFTLEEGSKAIAQGIDEPINLYFYLSRGPARKYSDVLEYADRVLGMLREFERASGDKLRLNVIDPEPFSEEEDQAVEQGLQGAPLPDGSGDVLYFGLVGTNATGTREAIPFFALSEEKQRTVEYDLSKLIWNLAHPDKKRVGILSALALEGGGGNPMLGQQGQPRWAFLDKIEEFFQVEVLPSDTDALDDVDILLVVHPRGFTDATLYLIDQWALAGKPLLVFVDPRCETDPGASDDPSNPMSQFTAKKDSDMEKLFKAWGIELAKNKIACDDQLGVRQPARSRDSRTQTDIPYIHLLRLGEANANRTDPITRLLGNLLTVTAGSLRKLPDGTTTFAPILETTERAQEVDVQGFQFGADPQKLLADFVPDYRPLTLAARVTGSVKTAFPEGKPGAPDGSPDESPEETHDDEHADGAGSDEDAAKEDSAADAKGLTESTQPLNVIVFSDVDLLHEQLWQRELGRLGSAVLVEPLSENVDLLKNSIESVSGGTELMNIRMRGKTSRPFERVQEIQREADQRFLARQQELERKLQDAERRLNELQKAKAEGTEELVSAAQREEETKVREEFVQTRRDLRDVQHQLRKDITRLGTLLKWLNIALMPALVCLAAVGLGAWRTKQRSRK